MKTYRACTQRRRTSLPPLSVGAEFFDNERGGAAINQLLEDINASPPLEGRPARMLDLLLHDAVLDAMEETGNSNVIIERLRENNVHEGWAPNFPTRLYFCDLDEGVPARSAEVALAAYESSGASDVSALRPPQGTELRHDPCAVPSLVDAYCWFQCLQRQQDAGPTCPSGQAMSNVDGVCL